jgi:acetoin utilization deacetylase AcuC-like enzyme
MNPTNVLPVAWGSLYAHPLPEGHRFPMLKYELIPEQLLYEGTLTPESFFNPEPCPDEIITLTHSKEYLKKLKDLQLSEKEQRYIGFPQSAQLVERELRIAQGTIDCCSKAFETGIALNVAGGTHHAFKNRGEGFCLLNDIAVAANWLLHAEQARNILIIDLDVHQGNGTAALFRNESRVFTFSMHGAHNYPFHKEISDWDQPLKDGIEDDAYLTLLETRLETILNLTKPDFAFYLSGVDILSTDKFGKLNISMEGCKQRDAMVFAKLIEMHIPCTVAMGGGYSPDIKTIVEAHCNTFRLAREMYGFY